VARVDRFKMTWCQGINYSHDETSETRASDLNLAISNPQARSTPSEVEQTVKIDSAEIRLVRLPLLYPFQISSGTMTERYFVLLTLRGEGFEGYGESVMDDIPYWREETLTGALELLKSMLLPAVIGKSFNTPNALVDSYAILKGNRMAKATLETAFWDLWAKSLGQPLANVLGGTRALIPVGVSLGIQSNLNVTLKQVETHLQLGYKRIKLKIQPDHDVKIVSLVRQHFPEAHLTVDANSAYTLADARVFQRLDESHLDYIEQPLAFDDIHDHAKLQAILQTPLCLDESIQDAGFARKALESGAARVINIKTGRVGGHLESRKIHDVSQAFGAPVWCGGMLESGIGRAHNIHLSTLENFTKPGDTSSSSRYWKQDIINEPLEVENGMMALPAGPGIGVSLNMAALENVTESTEVIE
jgi:o-succinylbenzoate synthase